MAWWNKDKKAKEGKEEELPKGFGESNNLTATEAIKKVKAMDDAGEVKKFTKGDERKTVYSAAEKQLDVIASGESKKKDEPKKEKKKASTPGR